MSSKRSLHHGPRSVSFSAEVRGASPLGYGCLPERERSVGPKSPPELWPRVARPSARAAPHRPARSGRRFRCCLPRSARPAPSRQQHLHQLRGAPSHGGKPLEVRSAGRRWAPVPSAAAPRPAPASIRWISSPASPGQVPPRASHWAARPRAAPPANRGDGCRAASWSAPPGPPAGATGRTSRARC
jgi:hypothetical protein